MQRDTDTDTDTGSIPVVLPQQALAACCICPWLVDLDGDVCIHVGGLVAHGECYFLTQRKVEARRARRRAVLIAALLRGGLS